MTDEEMAEKYTEVSVNEYKDSLVDIDDIDILREAIAEAYLTGLKAGRPKWHDLRKANDDLPLNTDPVLCLGSTGFIVCKYISGSWIDDQTIKLVPKYIDIYKWCEIEDTEE